MINKCLTVSVDKNKLSQVNVINELREYFNLYLKLRLGQLKQTHLLKIKRRSIALLKFCLANYRKDVIIDSKNKSKDK